MVSFTYCIKDKLGLHARPCALITKEAKKYNEVITLCYKDNKIETSRMLSLLRLGAKEGEEIKFEIDGLNEIDVAQKFEVFIKENL